MTNEQFAELHSDHLKAEVRRHRDREAQLQEWVNAVSSAIKTVPEFDTGFWAGNKDGWGYHFEVVNWLIRERARLASENAALRAALTPFADCVMLPGAPDYGTLVGWFDEGSSMPTVADVNRAREVLNKAETPR